MWSFGVACKSVFGGTADFNMAGGTWSSVVSFVLSFGTADASLVATGVARVGSRIGRNTQHE